jgi:amidophosphoribosyltransferase
MVIGTVNADETRENNMCGVFGTYNHKESAKIVYSGLYALQHRGQESCGIISTDGKKFYTHLGMGLVSEVFSEDVLDKLAGTTAIGHTRYSTYGETTIKNAQPIMVKTVLGEITLAHNGNLINAKELRDELEQQGSIFQTTSDSEIVLHLIAKSGKLGLKYALINALQKVKGAYSLIMMTKNELFGIRDPYGIRPLWLAKLGDSYLFASETCAFDLLGAKYIRELKPGEIVQINSKGVSSSYIDWNQNKKAQCIFEHIYFSRPDSKVFGQTVYDVRREFGRVLAKECPADVDFVIGVPDSAAVAAIGFAEQIKKPYEIGLIRSHYVGRTFIQPKQSIRDFNVRLKYNPVTSVLKDKKIVVVDDSIVRGTTSKKLIKMLRKAGVKEIHLRISSPPITYPCYYGIDTPTREELIAANNSVGQIKEYLGVDSLCYLSIEGMLKATGLPPEDYCVACFSGDYPIK